MGREEFSFGTYPGGGFKLSSFWLRDCCRTSEKHYMSAADRIRARSLANGEREIAAGAVAAPKVTIRSKKRAKTSDTPPLPRASIQKKVPVPNNTTKKSSRPLTPPLSQESESEGTGGDCFPKAADPNEYRDILKVDFNITNACTAMDAGVACRIASRAITQVDIQELEGLSFQEKMDMVMSHSMRVSHVSALLAKDIRRSLRTNNRLVHENQDFQSQLEIVKAERDTALKASFEADARLKEDLDEIVKLKAELEAAKASIASEKLAAVDAFRNSTEYAELLEEGGSQYYDLGVMDCRRHLIKETGSATILNTVHPNLAHYDGKKLPFEQLGEEIDET